MRACREPMESGRSANGGTIPLSIRILLPVLLFLTAATDLSAAPRISNYHAVFIPFYNEAGSLLAAIRRYNQDTDDRFLVLDPYRFELSEMSVAKVVAARLSGAGAWRETPFFRALARHTAPPYPLQNNGLREADHPVRGFFLTADLCPTKKPLERRFIESIAALPLKQPVPIAMMVSGLWIQRHAEDLAWLKEKSAAGRIGITWVNHSFSHPYDPAVPLESNFLLSPKTDFLDEVLSLERLLLEQGLPPSPFFRFPGLVSNRQLIEQLRDLSLIPIGSNAWLAKGESPQPGSIILVHANGNEPEGIDLLQSFFNKQREAFRRGDATLLPLREAFPSR
ncbi:MAG: polysaccharide deacetylase family protein [Syntrophales bacterium]